MKYYPFLIAVFEIMLHGSFVGCDISSAIVDYYNSETVRSFYDQWENKRKSYENALELALKDNFGKKGMNTIERNNENACKLSSGFYVFDNEVHVVLQDMHLKELPHINSPQVHFPLANNVLLIRGELSKMIVETKYSLMRNNSAVLFSGANQDPYKHSPFTFQQVQDSGHLAIIAEDCSLRGFTISTLSGYSVILGHDTFRVSNCKFTLEISAADLRSPVIAPYFSKEQRSLLENLITKPIRRELMTKLQATVLTYVNTSLFGNNLLRYWHEQQKVFKLTSDHVHGVLQNANKQNILKNKTSRGLRSLEIFWTDKYRGKSYMGCFVLKDVVVEGFDSAYSPHTGGPYKLQTIGIAESFRYNKLKVRGKILFEYNNTESEHEIYTELDDVTLNMKIDLEDKSKKSFNNDINVSWRNMVFSITNLGERIEERVVAESMISGYLINEIPKCLTRRLPKLSNNNVKNYISSEKNVNNEARSYSTHINDLEEDDSISNEDILDADRNLNVDFEGVSNYNFSMIQNLPLFINSSDY